MLSYSEPTFISWLGNWFTIYIIVGAALAVFTILKVRKSLDTPLMSIPVNMALTLSPGRSMRVLLLFVGAVVFFAWPPLVAAFLYKKYHRALTALITAGIAVYIIFGVVPAALEAAQYNAGGCMAGAYEYGTPQHWGTLLFIIALFVLFLYATYRYFKDEEPKDKEEPPKE